MAVVRSGDDELRAYVEAAVEGDNVAVSELVRATQPTVWRVCCALGTRGEEADLVQETYLRALRSLATYRGEAPVTLWLAAIARRVCADDVRRRQRRRRLFERVARASIARHVTPAPDIVDDVVERLADDRRDAFVLTQYAGLSYAEAAVVLGCPIGTVRSRVSRARADLVAMLAAAEAG